MVSNLINFFRVFSQSLFIMDMNVYDVMLLLFNVIESVAIIGANGLLVAAFLKNQKLHTAMNCYICSMCFSGLITGIMVPLGFGSFIGPYTVIGVMHPCDVQKLKTIVFYATACNSIYCMLAIAVERWKTLSSAVRHHRSNQLAIVSIIVGWTISVAYAAILSSINDVVEMRVEFDGAATNTCDKTLNSTACVEYRGCFPANHHTSKQLEIYQILTLIVIFIVPLCAISIIYCVLVSRLLRSVDHGSCGLSGTHRAKLRAIQAMILVVIIFAICWLPGHIFAIWSITKLTSDFNEEPTSPIRKIPILNRIVSDFVIQLTITHHWIHAFIYPCYSRQIAGAIKETISWLTTVPKPTLLQQEPKNQSTNANALTTSF